MWIGSLKIQSMITPSPWLRTIFQCGLDIVNKMSTGRVYYEYSSSFIPYLLDK